MAFLNLLFSLFYLYCDSFYVDLCELDVIFDVKQQVDLQLDLHVYLWISLECSQNQLLHSTYSLAKLRVKKRISHLC